MHQKYINFKNSFKRSTEVTRQELIKQKERELQQLKIAEHNVMLQKLQFLEYNLDYQKTIKSVIEYYKYSYIDYLQNPKILKPEIIQNKTFLVRIIGVFTEDEREYQTTFTIDQAQRFSDYFVFLQYLFDEIQMYSEKYENLEIHFLEISVFNFKKSINEKRKNQKIKS